MSTIPVTWTDRETPLVPCAVAAVDRHAKRLARRLLQFDNSALGKLSGVGGANVLVVLGEETELPWVDGVVYLGRDPSAPALLLPTRLDPVIPGANLLEKALQKQFPKESRPLAILPQQGPLIVPCGQALRITASEIEKWLAEAKT